MNFWSKLKSLFGNNTKIQAAPKVETQNAEPAPVDTGFFSAPESYAPEAYTPPPPPPPEPSPTHWEEKITDSKPSQDMTP